MARNLRGIAAFVSVKINAMEKEKMHLGQEVEWRGKKAVVDALTQSAIALRIDGGDYVVIAWECFAER